MGQVVSWQMGSTRTIFAIHFWSILVEVSQTPNSLNIQEVVLMVTVRVASSILIGKELW